MRRRVIAVVAFAWLPPMLLSGLAGAMYSNSLKISFFNSITGQVRFLIVLPILIAIEPYVQRQVSLAISRFLDRDIIAADELECFVGTMNKAHKIRNSYLLELGLLILVYTAGTTFWASRVPIGTQTWYANPDASGLHLTPAGYWFVWVSLPIFQFFLARWYARFCILFWTLLQISKLRLNLIPTHPDRAGGIAFLGRVSYAFAPLLFAQGALLSGMIAGEVIQNGREIRSFLIEGLAYISFFVIAVLAPLCVFVPALIAAKRRGLGSFGNFASQYVEEFDKKWAGGAAPRREELLGSSDIQSLADLANSYTVVREMNLAPFFYRDIIRLFAVTAAPLLPLLFLIFSVEELFKKILEVLL